MYWTTHNLADCVKSQQTQDMEVLPLDFSYLNITFLCVSILLIVLWIRSSRPLDLPPGPVIIPIIGNLYNLMQSDFLQAVRDLRLKYGDIYSLSLGTFWVVVVNGSENLRELLVKHSESTTDRPPFYMFQLSNNKGKMF